MPHGHGSMVWCFRAIPLATMGNNIIRRHHGCCWETFCIFAYCGLVGNPHLTAKNHFFAPLPTSTKPWGCPMSDKGFSLLLTNMEPTRGSVPFSSKLVFQEPSQFPCCNVDGRVFFRLLKNMCFRFFFWGGGSLFSNAPGLKGNLSPSQLFPISPHASVEGLPTRAAQGT